MKYNLDYLSAEEFDLMTEEQFLDYLDAKAKHLRETNYIKPLSAYHSRLGAMVSNMASGNTEAIEINKPKRKSYGRKKRSKW